MTKQPLILFYDIETCLLLNFLFGLGKQVIRHNQLLGGYFSHTHIITITYKWAHQKNPVTLTWGNADGDEKSMIELFDEQVQKADIVIGKNNKRFDDKLINTARMWYDLPGHPDWIGSSDDLESQMRRYFYLPSYSLDYFSSKLGLGGKDKMEFGDWVALAYYRMYQLAPNSFGLIELLSGKSIKQIVREGKLAIKKMCVYNKKDVFDTEAIWNYSKKHCNPKFNMATYNGSMCCKNCGSSDIIKNGTRMSGTVTYQRFECRSKDHKYGYAGKARINKNGTLGKIC